MTRAKAKPKTRKDGYGNTWVRLPCGHETQAQFLSNVPADGNPCRHAECREA